jgi:hypothetical protein
VRGAIVIGGWSIISFVLAVAVLIAFIDLRTGLGIALAALVAIGLFVTFLGRLGANSADGPQPRHGSQNRGQND